MCCSRKHDAAWLTVVTPTKITLSGRTLRSPKQVDTYCCKAFACDLFFLVLPAFFASCRNLKNLIVKPILLQ